ncbi:MAG TPA: DUF1521 domain-containing protein [Myxococcus sp.]|nr:DUF1521 domain-containing protein [Myxococcus sp.]
MIQNNPLVRGALLNASFKLAEGALKANLGLIQSTVTKALGQIESAFNKATTAVNNFADALERLNQHQKPQHGGGCFPCDPPRPQDGCRPSGGLKVDDKGVITTPGGYKIEQLGQFEWKINGPDGKSTRVWGDPHVEESDGGKFDFKRNTTFELPDGTSIHVTTKPWGNGGMTVTGQLDIVNGDDHVAVTDIDKGKGKVGQPDKNGWNTFFDFKAVNTDTLRMGNETDDWTFQGKEVIGDHNGGESFKLGNYILPDGSKVKPYEQTNGTNGSKPADRRDELLKKLTDAIKNVFDAMPFTRCGCFNPFRGADDNQRYDRNDHRGGIDQAFRQVRNMFRALDDLNRLSDMLGRRHLHTF